MNLFTLHHRGVVGMKPDGQHYRILFDDGFTERVPIEEMRELLRVMNNFKIGLDVLNAYGLREARPEVELEELFELYVVRRAIIAEINTFRSRFGLNVVPNPWDVPHDAFVRACQDWTTNALTWVRAVIQPKCVVRREDAGVSEVRQVSMREVENTIAELSKTPNSYQRFENFTHAKQLKSHAFLPSGDMVKFVRTGWTNEKLLFAVKRNNPPSPRADGGQHALEDSPVETHDVVPTDSRNEPE